MFSRIVVALACLWSFEVFALECEITMDVVPKTTWQNFRVRTPYGNELTLMTGTSISKALRDDIESSFSDPSMSFQDVAGRAARILAQNQDILADHASLLLYLNALMKRRELKNVYIDVPGDAQNWEARAKKMYLQAFQMQLRASPNDVSLDRLILIAIGPAMYIRMAEPQLYAEVDLENLPGDRVSGGLIAGAPTPKMAPSPLPAPPTETKPAFAAERTGKGEPSGRVERPSREERRASASDARKAADDAYEELEDRLRNNRSTLSTVQRFRREIQSGKYDDLSGGDVADKVAARVWRPARGAVREWVELEMKARRGSKSSWENESAADEFSARRRRHRHRHRSRDRSEDGEEEPRKSERAPKSKSGEAKFDLTAQDVHELAITLISREGHAVGFLRQEWYDRLLKEYLATCTQR